MNSNRQYSDEHISAYIDGELDSEERARLLYDEQQDAGLAARINQARNLKEKVQLAYERYGRDAPPKHARHGGGSGRSSFVFGRAAAGALVVAVALVTLATFRDGPDLEAAGRLIAATEAVPAARLAGMVEGRHRVIIDLNRYRADSFDDTLHALQALAEDAELEIEVVANGDGLRALDEQTSSHAGSIVALAGRFDNLAVIACARSLAELAVSDDPVELVASIITTPSALEQVARRSAEGWHYLKLN